MPRTNLELIEQKYEMASEEGNSETLLELEYQDELGIAVFRELGYCA